MTTLAEATIGESTEDHSEKIPFEIEFYIKYLEKTFLPSFKTLMLALSVQLARKENHFTQFKIYSTLIDFVISTFPVQEDIPLSLPKVILLAPKLVQALNPDIEIAETTTNMFNPFFSRPLVETGFVLPAIFPFTISRRYPTCWTHSLAFLPFKYDMLQAVKYHATGSRHHFTPLMTPATEVRSLLTNFHQGDVDVLGGEQKFIGEGLGPLDFARHLYDLTPDFIEAINSQLNNPVDPFSNPNLVTFQVGLS